MVCEIKESSEISRFDKGLETKEVENIGATHQADINNFNQNSKEYYQCKALDAELHSKLTGKFQEYVTDEKLE